MFFLTAGQIPPFAIWALVARHAMPPLDAYLPVVGGSILLNLVANIAYVEALRTGEISRTVPLLSLTPAVTALFAVPVLGEVPGARVTVGILLVVGGAWLLSAPSRAVGGGRSLALMLSVVAAWSVVLPLDKLGLEMAGPANHGLILSIGGAAGIAGILAARGRAGRLVRLPPRSRAPLAAAIGASAAALGTQLLALGLLPAAIVETAKRALGNLLALVWGRSLYREPVTVWKVLALLLLGLGVVLVLW